MKQVYQALSKEASRSRPRTAVAVVLGILLLVPGDVRGSEGSELLPAPLVDPVTGAILPVERVAFDPMVEEHRADVDFDGVALGDIVRWLREVPAYHDVNFVVSPRLADYGGVRVVEGKGDHGGVTMSISAGEDGGLRVVENRVDYGPNEPITVKLRSAGLRDILNAIGIATDNRVMFEVRTPTLVALIPGAGMDSSMAAELLPASPPPTYQVVNLRSQLRLEDPGALDETIRTVRELVGQTLDSIHGNTNLAPKLQLHPGSGILVIVGQPEAIKVTMDILRNLSIPPEN